MTIRLTDAEINHLVPRPEVDFHELDVPQPRPRDAEPAARLLVDTLRAHDLPLDDLRYSAWLNRSDRMLNLYGLGLAAE
ncbi:hypothetical protein [Embleya sp. NPDC001921]